MNPILLVGKFVCLVMLLPAIGHADDQRTSAPNILLILVDDLGFSDIGCFGGEIQTPNLDRLAKNGIRFTSFYNTGRCWPTRAALMTGYYAQQVGFDSIPGEPPARRGPRPRWAPMLPKRLKPLGYRCYHSGKWHLDGLPLASGSFDRSYLLKDQGRFFHPKLHWQDDVKLPPVHPNSGFYSTTAISNHAIETLEEHQSEHADRPFFYFLAFTAPHFPLHALPEDIAAYEGKYDVGWNEIRRRRWARIQSSGLLNGQLSEVEPEIGPPYDFPQAIEELGAGEINRPDPWDTLTPLQKRFQADKMELHAAMVHRIDIEIGRVVQQIREMGRFENTLILFLSDNGASAEIMIRADGHDPQAIPGSAQSYLCLGPGWSNACNTPFRRHKTWVHEGGTHTPMIVHWPNRILDEGALRRSPGHVIDIVPTLLEAAGSPAAKTTSVPGQVPPLPGISLLPAFTGDVQLQRSSLWWLHEGNRAIRVGEWKLVAARGQPWELFNVSSDPTEQHDRIADEKQRADRLASEWNRLLDEFRGQYRDARANLQNQYQD
jgi:arylsulfatase A-like enzyme